ncbi:MAG: hypothetical protein E7Z98_03640 [Olsenella sp.]|nr:hypothetical protein [Olsenella sp.]
MEWTNRECEMERLRAELLRIPSWAKAEQLERIIPQKDLWTPENLVRPGSKKEEETMVEKIKSIKRAPMATLAAVLSFAAATIQVADNRPFLGVAFFGAASCLSSLAGIYREREEREGVSQ